MRFGGGTSTDGELKECEIHIYIRELSKKFKIEILYNVKMDTIESVARDLLNQINLANKDEYFQCLVALILLI